MIKQKYVYTAVIKDIQDGDTVTALIDLGFELSFEIKVRLFGINAPELKTVEGVKTLDFVKSILCIGDEVIIETIKDKKEKFGRFLGKIYIQKLENQICLNSLLVSEGLAVNAKY